MVGWHHQFNGHEFGKTQGDGKGQGGLVCCSPWGCKELDTTQGLNNNNNNNDMFTKLSLTLMESQENKERKGDKFIVKKYLNI